VTLQLRHLGGETILLDHCILLPSINVCHPKPERLL
jgi:hypothetical protein